MEVIVTACRRAENGQRIPGLLSVVGDVLVDRSYTANTQQLSQLVPPLNYSSANPRNTAFTIRGLLDKDYIHTVTIQASNSGLILATPSDPRTIGLTFRIRQ